MSTSLIFKKSENDSKLFGYSDSDWGRSEDRHSISGYGFKLNIGNSLISWGCKKQRVVALSTCEAEYIALAMACQEAKFLAQLLSDLSCKDKSCVMIYVDNQSAIALAKNPVNHKRSKHIDIRYHFIRCEIEDGNVSLLYIPSEENVADVFTKPLSGLRIKKLLCM